MDLAIGILTIFLVLDALFLVLLILLQLPKKEAGLGTAFGGGATDALFGAGAGNVLTKLTTWGAVIFLVLFDFLIRFNFSAVIVNLDYFLEEILIKQIY